MRRTTTRRRAFAAPALFTALALGVGAVGCSSSSSSTTSTTAGPATTSAKSPGSTPGTTPKADEVNLPQITVKVKEDGSTYTFDAPETIEAGWVEVTLDNNGKLSHQAGIGHPVQGKTAADIQAAVKAGGANAALPLLAFDGGPNAVGPGATQKVIVKLDAGEHILYCMVPDVKDNKPHVEHGMVAVLNVVAKGSGTTTGTAKASGTTVAGTSSKFSAEQPGTTAKAGTTAGSTPTGTAPKTTSTESDPVKVEGEITLKDYGYLLPDGMTGKGWYKVVNEGPQPHELTIIKLNEGKTSDEARTWTEQAAAGTPPGPPPFADAGGFGAIDAKGVGYVYLDLSKGDYVAMCFVPDVPAQGRTTPPDLKPHFTHGMWQPFTVK